MSWSICQNIEEKEAYNLFKDFRKIKFSNYYFLFRNNNRFEEDKLFFEDKEVVIIIDGVLLNKLELYEEYKVYSMKSLIVNLYNDDKEAFINKLRGPFSGAVYDKEQDKLMVFGNQTGDTHVFHYTNEETLFISTDFNIIVEYLKVSKKTYEFYESAVNQMLTFGYLIDDSTFVKKIKRLQPGKILLASNHSMWEEEYHRFKNDAPIDISLEQSIELLDKGFRRALQRCFDKDIEYDYKHLVDISGGLDSRMVAWVANSLNYKNITNISYSQSMTNEQKYASEVSRVLGNEFIHKQLDDISFLYEPEEILKKNFGLASYEGITGGNQLLKSLNFNNYGLEHTGQLGDVVIGSYVSDYDLKPIDVTEKRISNHIKDLGINFEKYENQEIYLFYTRGMQGILSTHCTRRNYTEVVSPFLDVDFITLCFEIPLKYRVNHKLYYAWIEKKYPDALKLKVTTQKKVTKLDRGMIFSKLVYHRIKYELLLKFYKKDIIKYFRAPYNNMNPYRYWYETSDSLRSFLQSYYEQEIDCIDNIEIKRNIQYSFNNKSIKEKLAAITVVSIHKLYFNSNS